MNSLKILQAKELEDLICGEKADNWDISLLTSHIIPTHGYDSASPQYNYLMTYLSKLTKPMQRLFLQYATGSPRLPLGGFANLVPKMSISKRITPAGASPDDYLPSVMTCQNYIKIPEFTSFSVFQIKFDYALKEGQCSFTLS